MTDSTRIPNGIQTDTVRTPNASCAGAPQARSTATDTYTANPVAIHASNPTRAIHSPVENDPAGATTDRIGWMAAPAAEAGAR